MNTPTNKPYKKSRYNAFEKDLKRLSSVNRKELESIKIPKEAAIAQSFNKLVEKEGAQRYLELMMHLYDQRCKKLLSNSKYLRALGCICYFQEEFVNEIHTWKRPSTFVEKQFASLVRHLFAKYEMPSFFDNVWFANSFKHQQWYVVVAQGKNIRKCYGLPFEMSKKMSYYFMTAPARYDIYKALKWAKLMIYANGDAHLIQQIISTNYSGQARMQKEFWEKTIQFFSHNDRISTATLRGVFDFLVSIKRENPDFSFRGRTVASVVRLSDEWHQNIQLASLNRNDTPAVVWEKSPIQDHVFMMSRKRKTIKIEVKELMNSLELKFEGQVMNHCVGTYFYACEKREVAIFSIREEMISLATIEVNLSRREIVQAKAIRNKPISDFAFKVMKKWAYKNDLEIGEVL